MSAAYDIAPTVMPSADRTPFVGPEEAAAILGVSRGTVYTLLAGGKLPSIRVGKKYRVPVAELRRMAGLDPNA